MNDHAIGRARRDKRSAARLLLVAVIAAGLVLPSRPAEATHQPLSHVKGTFPAHGFLWLDDLSFYPSELWVYSDRCKSAESTTWLAVKAQLSGSSSEFRGAWPGGISFYAARCTSSVDNSTDIMLDYMTATEWSAAGHGNYGGHHHYSLASSSWCASFYVTYPCGYHISRIHINEPRFDAYSSSYKVSFLLHETAHSMGFSDYCGHVSVANNGMYCPLTGSWKSVDKTMLRDWVYKNSPVFY